jgi:hypothetical protein
MAVTHISKASTYIQLYASTEFRSNTFFNLPRVTQLYFCTFRETKMLRTAAMTHNCACSPKIVTTLEVWCLLA